MESTSSSSTGAPDGSDTTASVFDVAFGSDTGDDCVPTSITEMTCDGIDDDCNGIIDDVDEQGDGICDCLSIALIGNQGSNPASAFLEWLALQGAGAVRINPGSIEAATLAPYDIIILDRQTRSYSVLEAVAVETWVSDGGGLMAMSGYTNTPAIDQVWPNSILDRFGISYSGMLISGPVTDFAIHPTTEGLSSVTFSGGYMVSETMAGSTDVIAQIGATPVARATSVGDGRVFAWGDEWIQFDSEWSTMPEIQVFWANILTWLSPPGVCTMPAG